MFTVFIRRKVVKFFILSMLFVSTLYGKWAEETLELLTIREKIGQLFIVPACPKFDEQMIEQIDAVIEQSESVVEQPDTLSD